MGIGNGAEAFDQQCVGIAARSAGGDGWEG